MAQLLKDLTVDFSEAKPLLSQVIVNTHSPVLVGEMVIWQKNKNISVHYAEMRTRIFETGSQKVKLAVTKIIPSNKESTPQTSVPFSEQERKITIDSIKKYLETKEFEKAQQSLN